MKPHEETWTETEPGNRVLNGESTEVFLDVGPRLRLAAQAPAMARLLLFRMGDRHCEYCGAKVDRVTETGIQDPVYAGETLALSKPGSHHEGCALVAVLKAAGVME